MPNTTLSIVVCDAAPIFDGVVSSGLMEVDIVQVAGSTIPLEYWRQYLL